MYRPKNLNILTVPCVGISLQMESAFDIEIILFYYLGKFFMQIWLSVIFTFIRFFEGRNKEIEKHVDHQTSPAISFFSFCFVYFV